jgi:hypothetical protein
MQTVPFQSLKPFQGGYPKEPEFHNFEYEVHQVGLKDAGSRNFRFLALKEEVVGVTQISPYNGNGDGA